MEVFKYSVVLLLINGIITNCALTTFGNQAKVARVNLEESEGFILFIKPEKPIKFSSCAVEYKPRGSDRVDRYDLIPGLNQTLFSNNGETLRPLQFSNPYECGVRVLKVSADSAGSWTMKGTGDRGVVLYDRKWIEMPVKSPECPRDNYSGDFRYCSITDLDTDKQYNCSSELQLNNYKCEYYTAGKMAGDVKIFEDQISTFGPVTVESQSTILTCSSGKPRITTCYIEHLTSGRIYNIGELLHDKEYSAYKSDFSTGICQFEIPRPVQDQDVGIWRMNIFYPFPYEITSKSCLFHVKGDCDKGLVKQLEDQLQHTVVVKTIETEATIDCAKDLFYPIHLCYLVTKEGLIFNNDMESMARGSCSFIVRPGSHSCGFNGPTENDLDLVRKFEVVKFESEISKVDIVRSGGKTTLGCRHNLDQPIKYCLFRSPSHKVYRLTNDSFEAKEFAYFGGKFSEGFCGIILSGNVKEKGIWKCIFQDRNGNSFSTDISVTKP